MMKDTRGGRHVPNHAPMVASSVLHQDIARRQQSFDPDRYLAEKAREASSLRRTPAKRTWQMPPWLKDWLLASALAASRGRCSSPGMRA